MTKDEYERLLIEKDGVIKYLKKELGHKIAFKNVMKNDNKKLRLENENLQQDNNRLRKNLAALSNNSKLYKYLAARFVTVSQCTPDMKDKCLMFSEGLCEGERCNTFVDLESLLDQAAENGKIS